MKKILQPPVLCVLFYFMLCALSLIPAAELLSRVCVLQISHAAVSALCRSIKLQCELYSSRQIAICLDPYCGLGFVLWCLARWTNAPHCYGHATHKTSSSPLCSSLPCCFTRFCISPFSVYSGHQSILIPPFELESCLPLWLSTLSQYRIRDTFCSYSVMELCTKGLGTQTELLKVGRRMVKCM